MAVKLSPESIEVLKMYQERIDALNKKMFRTLAMIEDYPGVVAEMLIQQTDDGLELTSTRELEAEKDTIEPDPGEEPESMWAEKLVKMVDD